MTSIPLPSAPRTLVLIPTYNERENLPTIVERLHTANPAVEVLVLDDSSPDGTGAVADALATADPRVHVLHRTRKSGLGDAYLAGFAWGLDHGYELLVEMDADGSHPPETLPAMLARSAELSKGQPIVLVVGSRWIPGGRVVDWPKHREALSRTANLYVRLVLGISVRDATAGYRVYSADALRAIELGTVVSKGYCFQVDMTLRTLEAGGRVVEVPIVFREREVGESKMSGSIIKEAMVNVTVWGFSRRTGQLRRLLAKTLRRKD